MKNILLAIDFDDKTGKLFNMTLQIAEKFDSKVWIIHIAAPLNTREISGWIKTLLKIFIYSQPEQSKIIFNRVCSIELL